MSPAGFRIWKLEWQMKERLEVGEYSNLFSPKWEWGMLRYYIHLLSSLTEDCTVSPQTFHLVLPPCKPSKLLHFQPSWQVIFDISGESTLHLGMFSSIDKWLGNGSSWHFYRIYRLLSWRHKISFIITNSRTHKSQLSFLTRCYS